MERLCTDCGMAIRGRSDKRFCDDQCRSNYNNRSRSENFGFIKKLNSILKKNRGILERLNPGGKTRVARDRMLKEGYNFTYHTHSYGTLKGTVYYFCYEYGYLAIENEMILIVKNDTI
jgi:predicted nucleic acid-binding Zn ribbon protein